MDSHYMLLPVTFKKEDWKHKTKTKLSIDKAKEIQEFLMGRITVMKIREKFKTFDKENNLVDREKTKFLKCNCLEKRIINNFAVVEIDSELMKLYETELRESCLDNGVDLLTHTEMIQYSIDNAEGII